MTMKYKIKESFPKGNDVLFYHDKKVVVDSFGIHFYDENGNETGAIIDFFNGLEAKVVMEHYLLLRSFRIGFKLYDLDTLEELNVLSLDDEHMAGEHGYFVKDDRLYILSGSLSNRLVDFIMLGDEKNKEEKKSEIDIYSLKDLSFVGKYVLDASYEKMFYVSFLDKIYCVSPEGYVVEASENGCHKLEQIHFQVEAILADEDRKQILLQSLTGVRIYDEFFREINKIDFVEQDYSSVSSYDEMPMAFSMKLGSVEMEKKLSQRNLVHYLGYYDENTFLVLKSLNMGAQFGIELVDIRTGKILQDSLFGAPIEDLRSFKDNTFLLKTMGNLIILEVNE